jgi:hypothetical protein
VLEKRTRYGGSKYSARKRYALWEKHILQPLLLVARKLSPKPRSVEDDVPREVEHPIHIVTELVGHLVLPVWNYFWTGT